MDIGEWEIPKKLFKYTCQNCGGYIETRHEFDKHRQCICGGKYSLTYEKTL